MTTILKDLVTELAKRLVDLVLGEARYICCFKCIVEDFEKEKKKLIDKRKSVEEDVTQARNRAENVRYEIHAWLNDADKYIEEELEKKTQLEKEELKKKITCFHGLCPKCIKLYRRGKELDGMKLEMSELRKQNFEKVGFASKLPGVEFYSSKNFIVLDSRVSAYENVMEALKDGGDYIVGLHGMGGMGKTTLAIKVGMELKGLRVFDEVVFTTVSHDQNIIKIQDDIAGPLGLPLKEETESNRPKKLWSRLTRGDKVLIILDDLWNKIDFGEIGIPSDGKGHNCKVLLTSRDVDLCNFMGCTNTITLQHLSDKDAHVLFESLAGISNKSSRELRDKGKEIAKECKGLPVAIAIIASTLKNRPLDVWNSALAALRRFDDTDLIKIYRRLKVSYDYLNNEEAKKLFLLCSVFPEDYEIPVEDLTKFGIGLGLFGEVYSYETTRSHVDNARRKLVDSCLLLEGKEGCVKMHDLVRDAAQWIANKDNQFGILDMVHGRNTANRQHINTIKYLYCRGVFINDQLDWSKLEILILAGIDEGFVTSVMAQEAFFGRMKNLRVLALENGKKWRRLDFPLPQSIGSLKSLRTLCLLNFKLSHINVVEDLQNLEIFELRDCSMHELPIEIAKLTKLKLLSIMRCQFRQNPYTVIGLLSNVQELYFKNIYKTEVGATWDLNKEVVANLFGKESISSTLQRYHIEIRSGSQLHNWLFDARISRALAIQYFDPDASNAQFLDLVRKAECLDLLHIQGDYKSVIPDIIASIGGNMNNLITFMLYCCPRIEYLVYATNTVSLTMAKTIFSNLVYLYLYYMDALKTLCYSLSPQQLSLERLVQVHLKCCPALTSLFTSSTAQSLVVLEQLVIRECNELKYIIIDEPSGEEEIVEDSHVQMFPKLKTLAIGQCDQLEFVFPNFYAGDLRSLENIELCLCGQLKYLFGQCRLDDQVSQPNGIEFMFPSLERMKLDHVPKFVNMFPKCCHPNLSSLSPHKSAPTSGLVAEQQDPHKRYTLTQRVQMCCLGSANKPKSRKRTTNAANRPVSKISNYACVGTSHTFQCLLGQSLILRNIKLINLSNCGEITSLFSLSIAAKMLLQELTIDRCHGLKHIITDMGDNHDYVSIFPNLKRLVLKNCSKLIYMVGRYHDDGPYQNAGIHIHLSALEDVSFLNLPNMVSICPINYYATHPRFNQLSINNCPKFADKSIINANVGHPDATQLDGTATTDLEGFVKHLLTLEVLNLGNFEIEDIFGLEGLNKRGQQMSLNLRVIKLRNLSKLKYIWRGLMNFLTFQNLNELRIEGCDKLEIVFSDAMLRRIPLLKVLIIINCQNLEKIVEEEEENLVSPQVCFPELRTFVVQDSITLKHVLPVSTPNEFPKLKCLVLVKLPNLTNVCGVGRMELEKVEYQFVHGCNPNFTPSPTWSTAALEGFEEQCLSIQDPMELGFELCLELKELLKQITESLNTDSDHQSAAENPFGESITASSPTGKENLNSEITEAAPTESEQSFSQCIETKKEQCLKKYSKSEEAVATSSTPSKVDSKQSSSSTNPMHKVPSQEELVDEPSAKDQQLALGKTKNTFKILERPKEMEGWKFQEYHKSEELIAENWSKKANLVSVEEMEEGKNSQEYPKSEEILTDNRLKKADHVEHKDGKMISESSSKDQQWQHAETENTIKIPQETNSIEKKKEQNLKECSKSEEAVATSSTPSKVDSKQASSSINPMHEVPPQAELVDETSAKDQQQALGKTEESINILKSTELIKGQKFQECPKSKELAVENQSKKADRVKTSSTLLETQKAQLSPSVSLVNKASQTETYIDMDSHFNDVNIQDAEDENLNQLMKKDVAAEEAPAVKDNLLAKVLADLEVYLNMHLKDIACSKSYSIRLQTSLNFLSRLSIENGALSDELKSTVDSLQQEFPSLLYSFKQAFATVRKFAELEDREKSIKEEISKQTEADFTLSSIISQINKLKDEAQRKEASLKNHISRLQIELESVNEDKSQNQMMDKQKAQQRLLEMDYEWSFLCSQFQHGLRSRMASTSTNFDSRSSSGVHLHEASPQGKIRVSQSETSTAKDIEANRINFQDFQIATGNSIIKDNLVTKALCNLEVSLKMPLKDIATSKTNTIHLYTALNFLSNLPFEDGAISEELKAIINSLHQNFPSILCSFNEAFAMIKKFAELEEKEKSKEEELEQQKERATSLDFEAKQKDAILKEQINWLQLELDSVKEKIRGYEASLSSFEEEKNKFVADNRELEKEFERVKKEKHQMVGDQTKAQQELLETNYKWWALCSRFKINRITPKDVF